MDGPLNSSRDSGGDNRGDNCNRRNKNDRGNHHHHNNNRNRHPAPYNNDDRRHRHRNDRPASRSRSRERYPPIQHGNSSTKAPSFTTNKIDPNLPQIDDDPRPSDPSKRISTKALSQAKGRNTESFHAESTFVRPDLRVQIGSPRIETYNKTLKHDDVVIVPELFGEEDDLSLYYQLVKEMRDAQEKEKEGKTENQGSNNEGKKVGGRGRGGRGGGGGNSKSEWIPWHEGCHLISKKPDDSPTYQSIVKRLCEYFDIDTNKSVGTRFNWYRDSNDWKPFHHDSAAFNPGRAKSQNITIGVSFGAMRELAFIRTKHYATENNNGHHDQDGPERKCKLYFPQSNNGVFSFGRDANIHWKHGINALRPSEQSGKGRISIILWGFAKKVIEEDGSPPLLGSDGKGPHAGGGRGYHFRHGGRGGGRGGGRKNDDRGRQHDDRGRQHDDRRYNDHHR